MTAKIIVSFLVGAIFATSICLAVFIDTGFIVITILSSTLVIAFCIGTMVEHWDD
jgi:hypothetical protein